MGDIVIIKLNKELSASPGASITRCLLTRGGARRFEKVREGSRRFEKAQTPPDGLLDEAKKVPLQNVFVIRRPKLRQTVY